MVKERRRRMVRALCGLALCISFLVLLCAVAVVLLRSRSDCDTHEEDGQFKHAAVAADSLTCSRIGRDMLLAGGSAVDAAIAALLCTSLINPQSMGLGGGSIFTIMDKDGNVKVISSRETVPSGFSSDVLKKQCPSTLTFQPGVQWIGVPGELRGYAHAHRLYGRLPWAKLFEPTITMARDGFNIPPFLSQFLQHPLIKQHVTSSRLCDIFCYPNKTVFGPGEKLRYPKLAETLQIVADEGAESFYTGRIAELLIQDVQTAGGSLTLEDLSTFQVRESKALSVPVGEFTMHFPPPPSGGALLSFIFKLMLGFGLSPESLKGEEEIKTLHRYIETLKFTNGQKKNIKDPQFHSETINHLMSDNFIDMIRSKITDKSTHPLDYYDFKPSTDRLGTSHVSVIASDGSAVSVTSTINQIFGSAVYSPNTGVILNNELADFCHRADSASVGEQPPSFMSPLIMHSKNREKILVIGGSGGSMIIPAIASSVMNHLWFGKTLKDSISAELVQVNSRNSVVFEPGFNQSLNKTMQSFGHVVENNAFFLNAVNGISKQGGCISAYSDARKKSKASGY